MVNLVQRTIEETFIGFEECWDKIPVLKRVNIADDSSQRDLLTTFALG